MITDIFACNENFALWLYIYTLHVKHTFSLVEEKHKKLLNSVITDVTK